jgi:hypothetical protein
MEKKASLLAVFALMAPQFPVVAPPLAKVPPHLVVAEKLAATGRDTLISVSVDALVGSIDIRPDTVIALPTRMYWQRYAVDAATLVTPVSVGV